MDQWREAEVQKRAVIALGELAAIEPLIDALKHERVIVREEAADALGKIGDPRAVEPLLGLLRDMDLRFVVPRALSRIGGERTIESLVALLMSKEYLHLPGAAEALEQLNWQPDNEQVAIRYYTLRQDWGKFVGLGESAVEPLIAILRNDDYFISRLEVIDALGKIGDRRAVGPLIAALSWAADFQFTKSLRDRYINEITPALTKLCGEEEAARELVAKIKNANKQLADIYLGIGRADTYRMEAIIMARSLVIIGEPAILPIVEAFAEDNQVFARVKEAAQILEQLNWRASKLAQKVTIEQIVELLGLIYRDYPEGIFSGTAAEDRVREIGEAANQSGGMKLMLNIHKLFATQNPKHARNLEMRWSGIGDWRG